MSPIPNSGALEANKKGRLSLFQSIALLPWILLGGVFFLAGAFISVGMLYGVISGEIQRSIVIGVIFGSVFSLLLFFAAYMIGGVPLINLVLGRVRHVEGKAFKDSHQRTGGNSRGYTQTFVVGQEQFQVSKKIYEALPESGMVRAYYYYNPFGKMILVNVEKI